MTTVTATKPATQALAAVPPATTIDVTTRAMLVDLNIHQWTGVKRDRAAERSVAASFETAEDDGHYIKKLGKGSQAGELFKQMKAKTIQLADEHRNRTCPWHDGGTRILSSAGYFEYTQVVRKLIAEYDDLADQFVPLYPDMIEADRIRLKGMFNPSDYPSPSRIRIKFGADYRISPLPTAQDFRVDMSKDEYDRVCTDITSSVHAGLREAMKEPWSRAKKAVLHMVERLNSYNDKGDKVVGVFRDSLVANMRDLVATLPALNVTGDAGLDEVISDITEKLCRYDAITLREDFEARAVTSKAASDILDKMSAFAA